MSLVHRNTCHMKKQRRRQTAKATQEWRFQAAKAAEEEVADKCWICGCAGCQPQDCLHPDALAKREERLKKRREAIAIVKDKLPYIIYTKKIRKDQRSESSSPMTPRAEDIHNIPMRMWKREILQWDKQLKQKFLPHVKCVIVKNTFLQVNDEPDDSQPVGGRSPTRYYRRAATDSVLRLADDGSECAARL